jgi:hypothetical protein
MDDLFALIGKLYVDSYNSQKVIEILQEQVQDKDKQIEELQRLRGKDERGGA